MIEIAGKLINPSHIVNAEVETRHYMNGSESWLVIEMDTGLTIRQKHGFGVDVWRELDKLKAATSTKP